MFERKVSRFSASRNSAFSALISPNICRLEVII